jgi:hypothetical protein
MGVGFLQDKFIVALIGQFCGVLERWDDTVEPMMQIHAGETELASHGHQGLTAMGTCSLL